MGLFDEPVSLIYEGPLSSIAAWRAFTVSSESAGEIIVIPGIDLNTPISSMQQWV